MSRRPSSSGSSGAEAASRHSPSAAETTASIRRRCCSPPPRAVCARVTLRPRKPAGCARGRLRRRRRSRAPSPSSTTPGARSSTNRTPRRRGRGRVARGQPGDPGQTGRGAAESVHTGLLQQPHHSGRCHRPDRRRRAAPDRCTGDTGARQQGSVHHIAKRDRADEVRRRRTTSSWSVRISTACVGARHQRQRHPAWRRVLETALQLGAAAADHQRRAVRVLGCRRKLG